MTPDYKQKTIHVFTILLVVSALLVIHATFPVLAADLNRDFIAAVKTNDLNSALILLKKGADVNAMEDKKGVKFTALGIAIKNNYPEMAKMLIGQGVDVNSEVSNLGDSPLGVAAASGNLQLVTILVENGARVSQNDDSDYLMPPVSWAAMNGRIPVLRYLLENGADIDGQNFMEETPLFFAARGGEIDTVKFLLAKGANVNIRNTFGETVLAEISKPKVRSSGLHEPKQLSRAKAKYPEILQLLKTHGAVK
jgi:ankyrin repeat protein